MESVSIMKQLLSLTLIKKSPSPPPFYGTGSVITVLTRARQPILISRPPLTSYSSKIHVTLTTHLRNGLLSCSLPLLC